MASSGNYSAVLQDSNGSNLRFVASEHQFQTWGAAQSGTAALSQILASSNQTTVMTVRGANVGIGATNPLAKLQVSGNVGIGTAYATLASPIDGCIILGNVGIGTATPTTKLHVVGTMQATVGLTLGSATLTSPLGAMPMFACRAWINFNGTLTTGVYNAGGNIASLARNSAGNYTITFAVAMPSANYATFITFDGSTTSVLSGTSEIVKSAGSVTITLFRASSSTLTTKLEYNPVDVSLAVFM